MKHDTFIAEQSKPQLYLHTRYLLKFNKIQSWIEYQIYVPEQIDLTIKFENIKCVCKNHRVKWNVYINSRAVCALLGMSQITSMARHYHRLVNLTQTLENKYS